MQTAGTSLKRKEQKVLFLTHLSLASILSLKLTTICVLIGLFTSELIL